MQIKTSVVDGKTVVDVIDPSDGAAASYPVGEGEQFEVGVPGASTIAELTIGEVQTIPEPIPDSGVEGNPGTEGTDAGSEVIYKPTTVGGIQAVAGLIEAIRDRLNSSQHGGKVSPIVRLEKDSYPHPQFGKVWTPALTIVDWMSLSGPAPAPKPASPPPTEQPRRRRVG